MYARLWNWSRVGKWVEQHHAFICKQCLSMVVALTLDEGIVAVKVQEGLFTGETFLEYLWDDMVCLISTDCALVSLLTHLSSCP